MITPDTERDATLMTMLRRHRLAAGLDQGELARRLGVSNSAVSFWESGKCVPKAKMFPKLSRVLGIKPIELTRCIQPEETNPGEDAK